MESKDRSKKRKKDEDDAAAAPEADEEKKEKKTANVKLVKYDAKDKIKVGTETWVDCRSSRRCAVCWVSV